MSSFQKELDLKVLSAPIMINFELTSGCNIKCRHCYNFWRENPSSTHDKVTIEKMDKLIDMMVQDKVFHVVLTGGEPFLNFKVLSHGLKRCRENNISTSVNSNLMLATDEKLKELKEAGLDHILTSLNSCEPAVNDYMVNKEGAFEDIVRGIKAAVANGIRISVNMIISEPNKHQVYDTAKFCASLGVTNLFATRLVPSVRVDNPNETDLKLERDDAIKAVKDLVRAKKDFNIGIGSLISYPLCMLGDLHEFKDLVGRGCPAQRGNRMVVNASGDTHACTHEMKSYGNVFEIGIKEAFKKMSEWHDGSYLFEKCKDCNYITVCRSGCRSASYSYFKEMNNRDPLYTGSASISKHYKIEIPEGIKTAVKSGEKFIVPETVRFRKEDGFYVLDVRWANAFNISSEMGVFLEKQQKGRKAFSVSDVPGPKADAWLIALVFKEAVVPENPELKKSLEAGRKAGCSLDPSDIIQLQNI
jgi:radical SAM protein with 4Fe4S-binding SPASM domain